MNTPEADYRALLPILLGLYPSLPGLTLQESHRPITHVAHGWYMRCHRGVQAVFQLEETGFQEEASPIRRSILEHVVALKWLAEQGGVVADILKRGAAHDAAKRKVALVAANWTAVDLGLFDAVIADQDGTDPQYDNLLHFKQRCDRFGTPHDWTTYLVETARSHPCWESAVPYMDVSTGRPLALDQPEPVIDQAGFCVIHLFEALVAIDHMIAASHLTPELERLDVEIRRIAVRQRREQGLHIPDGFDPDAEASL
ncbi:MAG: hypothetical protein QOH56_382 [Pseudonocardiales bacterium]|jgi:hypothetical protein|nr:hypothetical protein [Pseudonocardiales bacterium]